MSKRASTIVLALLASVAVISTLLLVQYYVESFANQSQYDALSVRKSEAEASASPEGSDLSPGGTSGGDVGSKILPQYRELATENADMVGWIRIPGTVVDYPVMHTPNAPQYYLTRNFSGQRTNSGSIFMDARYDPARPQNLILYGHNMKSGTMFGVLSAYQREAFTRQHDVIYFDTLTEERCYEVVACFTTAVTGTVSARTIYDYVDLDQAAELEQYSSLIRAHGGSDESLAAGQPGDYLTLSTCTGDSDTRRLVVVAQRMRE